MGRVDSSKVVFICHTSDAHVVAPQKARPAIDNGHRTLRIKILINPPCHRVQGHDRPVCYTDSRMNYWGYCDCEENGDVKWTRPFGWYSSFHNAAFRQGDDGVDG